MDAKVTKGDWIKIGSLEVSEKWGSIAIHIPDESYVKDVTLLADVNICSEAAMKTAWKNYKDETCFRFIKRSNQMMWEYIGYGSVDFYNKAKIPVYEIEDILAPQIESTTEEMDAFIAEYMN